MIIKPREHRLPGAFFRTEAAPTNEEYRRPTSYKTKNRNDSGRSRRDDPSYDPYGQGQRRRNTSGNGQDRSRRPAQKRRRRHAPHLSTVIFIVLLVYILIEVIQYSTSDSIAGYEVRTGSLSSNQIYTGIIVRTEEVVDSEYPGYVNYYTKEADRIGVGQLAYTIDESGQIMEYLESQNSGESILSDTDYDTLQKSIIDFEMDFDPHSFNSVYDFRESIKSEVQKMSSSYILDDINSLSNAGLSGSIHQCYASDTGIISYSTDSLDGATFESLTADDFSDKAQASCVKTTLESNQLVDTGDPVYRLCTDENWSIVIMTDADTAKQLTDDGYIQVRFVKNRETLWASVSSRTDESGNVFVDLSFTNSMIDFCSDRYEKIELITEQEKGLKVPNSAIVKSEFFLVPKDYVTTGTSGNQGVLLETYDENGTKSVRFTTAVPYSEKDDYYYLDQSVLKAGDVIDKPDSTDTYTISDMDELIGVYNINRGYADFREVKILYQNDEYSIVEPNTLYGLSEYDHIVLNASEVTPDTIIYN